MDITDAPIQEFKLPPEQQAIRDKCFHPSGTFVEFPVEDVETSIPARFEKIVRRYPERVAVKIGGEIVTYSALDAMANRFAHALAAEKGLGNDPIGLLFEKNAQAVAAMLGVLKVGKFFVLLDPCLPIFRVTDQLRDSGAKVVFSDYQNTKVAKVLAHHCSRIIMFEELATHPEGDASQVYTPPETFAFLAFTSGSTGKPKGVIQTHRNLLAGVMRYANLLRICPEDRVSLLPAWSSNAIQIIMLTLLNGATLLPISVQKESVGSLAHWLRAEAITCSWINSALFRSLCEILTDKQSFPHLRLLRVTTEVYKSDIILYKNYFSPKCIIARGYASSEADQTTTLLIDHDSEFIDDNIPVGYPLEGIDVSIVDENGEAVGFNTIGEIVAKSRYLSPGYWLNPELTTERYRNSPNDSEERVYFSGDLGLLLPDGNLVYKGRKDFQVKIRGYNVSLDEIEKTLLEHPTVQQTGVVAWEQRNLDKSLVAYVVTRSHSTPTTDQLRNFLTEKLPDYMIPSTFVYMDSLPMRNGKLDREALPKPGDKRPDGIAPYVPPQNEIQTRIAQIWEDALAVSPMGIHDNFFDLGGHSLLAMRILSAVNRAFSVDLSMRVLLDLPTVAGVAQQIEHLQETNGKHTQIPSPFHPFVSASSQGRHLPLSYAEEGLWLVEQIRPGNSAWNMQSRLRLRGPLDLELLRRSFDTLIQRHDILRTAYGLVDDTPVRVIVPELRIELKITHVDPSLETEAQIESIISADKRQPFCLTEAPLFRIRLVRVTEQDHVLIVTKHHIITDAWSSNLFIREMFELYGTFTKNRPSALKALAVQYSDYARWIRQSEQTLMADHLAYWVKKLKGLVVQEMPTDAPRTRESSFRGGQEHIHLSKTLSRNLSELSKAERSTQFMLLVAAFKILLSRYAGSSDIVIGSTLAGRSQPELQNLIGMFINILTLRTNLSGRPSFRELLARVRETCLEAYQHQDMAFEKLVQALNPGQGLTHNPFFQVLFNVVSLPPEPLKVDELTIESISRLDDSARFDLSLSTPQNPDGIEIIAAYNQEIFSRDRIVEMLEQYKYLLEQIVEDPDRKIEQYSLVTPSAQRLLPNPTLHLEDTWQGAVCELMAQQAKKQPNKVALEDPYGVWTYKQLDQSSNQLANFLLDQGIKRADIVAVHGNRSAALVCALLGILKAGAAFCVIDPSHPAGRIAEYWAAANPKALIELGEAGSLNAELEPVLNSIPSRFRIGLRRPTDTATFDLFTQSSIENPNVSVGPDDLAYIIFTSGSTGKPKGVLGRHGPLTHFLPWLTQTFGLSELDRFSFLSSIATNKLQREIFTALAIGGSLYIPSDDTIGSFGTLDAWLREKEISVIHLAPAMAQLLADTARAAVPSVRRAFFGGDLLQMRDVKRTKAIMPNAEIVNFYNSSETQRGGAYFVFSDQELQHYKDIPPLGRGVKDVQLLILNPNGQLAGIGEQGEIYVRSPHLARGYLGDEALTSTRFISNPFTGAKSDRIYKTGELGRYLPDGSVEFVARAENQVSIRGFRVDVGEIESVLKNHPNVVNAIVALQQNSTDRLIVYLILKPGTVVSIADMRAFLRKKLPNYMIPAAFVFCDFLPLTPTGKIDRQGLATVDLETIVEESKTEPPRTPLEESLAEIWGKVLKLSRIGVQDNFFDLGGHSLLAIQVMSRLPEVLGIDLPIRVMFEAPTIAEMALVIESRRNNIPATTDLPELLNEIEKLSESEAQRQVAPDDE